nr:hypothetical protein CKG001_10470 [Bdellovibrio sp. CKG001]
MIFGECPNCGAGLVNELCWRTPCFTKEVCPSCDKPYWLLHSRINPVVLTVEEFESEYQINPETRQVSKKEGSNE